MAAERRLPSSTRGTVYVELLFVFPPLLLLFLCTIQYALLYASHLGIRHAAGVGARAAVVILPDDRAFYEGAPKNIYQAATSDCEEPAMFKVVSALGDVGILPRGFEPRQRGTRCAGGPRIEAIRSAVYLAVTPFAADVRTILADEIGELGGLGSGLGEAGWVAGALLYNLGATSVTFPAEPGARVLMGPGDTFDPHGQVTVRVTHLYHCAVPLARLFMCDTVSDIVGVEVPDIESWEDLEAFRDREERSLSERASSLVRDVRYPEVLALLAATEQRFVLLSEESTLPLHGADYAYQSEVTP